VRERKITQPIYTGSLNLELHPVSRKPLGPTSNQSQITTHIITKRWSWYHKNHSPSLLHTPLVRTPSNFTGFHTLHKFIKEQIQESWKEHITPEFTGITELLKSDLELVHNYLAILQTFEFFFSKSISISLYLISFLLFYCFERKTIFIALKTSCYRHPSWGKIVLI